MIADKMKPFVKNNSAIRMMFEEGNKLVKVEIPAEYAMDARNSYPRFDYYGRCYHR